MPIFGNIKACEIDHITMQFVISLGFVGPKAVVTKLCYTQPIALKLPPTLYENKAPSIEVAFHFMSPYDAKK